MKLRFISFLTIVMFIFAGCKTTSKVKNEPVENAQIDETTVTNQASDSYTEIAEPEDIPSNEPLDYDDAGEEIFVYVPEDESSADDEFDTDEFFSSYYDDSNNSYISIDDDSHSSTNTSTKNSTPTFSFSNNGVDLTKNDYSDDYEKSNEDDDSIAMPSNSSTAVAKNNSDSSKTDIKRIEKKNNDKSESNSSSSSMNNTNQIEQNSKKQNTTSSSKNGYVATDSFYIDYSSEKYKDYSGYNYGDKDYNRLIATFGPNSFPSDKIMAPGRKSAEQLYNFFASKNPHGDLARAKKLAQLYIEECSIEGVNSDLAFVQMCHETGFLKFGNLVTPDMNNFCGLGSVSKANPGLKFETDRMGVRAHVQHLQAYGSTTSLNQSLIDPRYKYVLPRGKAPTLAGLTGTWAMDSNYDRKIYTFMKELAYF